MMNLHQAKETLFKLQNLNVKGQTDKKKELEEAFRVFWSSNPSENDFERHMRGIVITARIFYMAAKG